jgi:hypothetical protein
MSILNTLLSAESGGRNIPNTTQGTSSGQAQGYFQITTGTWNDFGGGQFASTPDGASYAQQASVASNIPVSRWAPSTVDAMAGQGNIVPSQTLGQNLANNGENIYAPTGQYAALGNGAPAGGGGGNFDASGNLTIGGESPGFQSPTTSSFYGSPNAFGSAGASPNNSGFGGLQDTSNINAIGNPDLTSAPSTGAAAASSAGMANPPAPMQSVPGTSDSQTYMNQLQGMWETSGVAAVTQAANTGASATAAAATATNQQNAADTGALVGSNASIATAAMSAVTGWLTQGSVILFGLIFIAGGVWFFSRQEA